MGTDALLVTLEQRPVTSPTVGGLVGVTPQLAPALGCTPVTAVTAAIHKPCEPATDLACRRNGFGPKVRL